MLNRLRFLVKVITTQGIARRYFVTNGFDGALTMLGLIMGFYTFGDIPLSGMLSACLGAAIALCMSGLTSAYISEAAEKKRELNELEQALLADLSESNYGVVARFVPLVVALVNGFSPLLISLFIISPLGLALYGIHLPFLPLEISIFLAFISIFCLGIFLGKISGTFWLWSALKTTVIGLITALVILFLKF